MAFAYAACRIDAALDDGRSYANQVLADGPVGYWRMDAASGTSETDRSTGGHNGTYHGGFTLNQTGPLSDGDAAAAFDGATGSGLSTAAFTTPFGTGPLSVEGWIKAAATGLTQWFIDTGTASTATAGFNVSMTSAGTLVLHLANGVTSCNNLSLGSVANGAWHHFVAVLDRLYDGVHDRVRWYIDGVLDSTGNTATASLNITSASALWIGTYGGGGSIGNNLNGTVDEVTLYNYALSATQVATHYAYRVLPWTSLATDLSRADRFTWRRGMQGGGPLDLVAVSGSCEFALKNDERNSAATLGYYSPNHPSVRVGFGRGIPIRVVATYASIDTVLWRGTLRSIDPVPGRYGPRITRCVAYDCMWDLGDNDATGVAPQINQTENQLVAALLSALPTAAQPVATSYDASLDTYPYAFDNASSGENAMSLLTAVATSARAFIYPRADGTLHVENRQARSLASSVFTFSDLDLDELSEPTTIDTIWNHVRVVIHPRTIDAAPTTVLYALTGPQRVAPGETVDIFGDYSDPTNALKLIGGTAQVVPIVAGTDYAGNAAADGSGASTTGDLSIVTSAFAAAVKFAVTNTGAATVFLVDTAGAPRLQLRGKGIADNAPVYFEAQSVQSYDRLLILDLPYQADPNVAQDLATTVEQQYASLANQVLSVGFLASKSDALMARALASEIGQVVTVTELVTGVTAVDAVINAIEMEALPGLILHCRYITAPLRGGGHPFVLDDAVFGVLDSAVGTLGYT